MPDLSGVKCGNSLRHYSLCDHAGHIILYYGKPDHRCHSGDHAVYHGGNAILVLGVGLVTKKCKGNGGLIAGMAAGSVVKALFMGIVISLILIPNLLPAPMEAKMAVFQTTFSVTQLVTSLIGSVYAFILWIPLKKVVK